MPRTRDTSETRRRLSEAVFTTLAELGPTGLTLRAVAERAGCTTGLVLHTFRDKQALLLHARDVLHERTRIRSDALEAAASGPVEALRAVLGGALPTDPEKLAEARVWVGFLAAALGDPVLAERHAVNSRAFATRLERLVTSAHPTGPTDASDRSAALAAAVEGIAGLAAGDPERWTPARQRAALDLVIDSTGPAASAPATATTPAPPPLAPPPPAEPPVEVLRLTAFAAGPGGGNPAGVVLDASGLTDERMQRIAAEVGYAETAFVVDPGIDDGARHVAVRYFSPGAEVPFCGHATIATAVALAERRGVGAFTLDTAVGPVVIETARSSGGAGDAGHAPPGDESVTAAFTSVEPAVRDLDALVADRLLGLLGLERADLDERWPLREAFAGNWHPVVAVREQAVFDAFRFDPREVRVLMDERGWAGTVTVVHRQGVDESGGLLVETRNLFPVGDITEDPATGSAAASLGGYLRALGEVAPPARIVVRQGRHVGRPSLLVVDVPPVGGITVTGTARPID